MGQVAAGARPRRGRTGKLCPGRLAARLLLAGPSLLAGPFLAVLGACSGGEPLRTAPASLAGLEVHHEISGQRARAAIQRLHGGTGIEVADAWIAQYGMGPTAMLYVGRVRDEKAAVAVLEAMRGRIAAGGTPFHGIRPVRLFGKDLYVLAGQGQLHFLFRDGSRVVWLSADPPVACGALAEALRAKKGDERCEYPWDPLTPSGTP